MVLTWAWTPTFHLTSGSLVHYLTNLARVDLTLELWLYGVYKYYLWCNNVRVWKQKQRHNFSREDNSCIKAHCWINIATEGPWVCSKRSWESSWISHPVNSGIPDQLRSCYKWQKWLVRCHKESTQTVLVLVFGTDFHVCFRDQMYKLIKG